MTSVLLWSAWMFLQSGAGGQISPPAAAATPQAPPREWIVVLVSPVYLPDGSVRAETVALPTSGAGLVHLFSRKNLCSPASSAASEPNDAAFGWRVASQMVTRSETDVVVSLDWRRMWDAGKKINNGPGGTVQLTLHKGDRIPLDHIVNSSPVPECRAVGLGLEVRLARTPLAAPAPAANSLPPGATAGGAKPVNAELWLTHTSPTDTAQVFHQVVRLPEAGGRFSFTSTPVTTTRGEIDVELTGTIDRFRLPDGAEYMVLSMNRLASGAGLPPAGLSFSTSVNVPMPGAQEVLSFEMVGSAGRGQTAGGRGGAGGAAAFGGGAVASRGTGGSGGGGGGGGGGRGGGARGGVLVVSPAQLAALLEGHQFSLRMRITPVN
ncbi:MAG TPA: hypothetical protein VFV98_01320 [Vicinamibacterales bacterium]|nr:hypothetical protein [Vicinamibacterales bacterium]